LLKRRSAASNDSFSPTLTSANLRDHLPSVTVVLSSIIGTVADDVARVPGPSAAWRCPVLGTNPRGKPRGV
jgi:hypothetical protein